MIPSTLEGQFWPRRAGYPSRTPTTHAPPRRRDRRATSGHNQVEVAAPDGTAVRVDERLGRLLPALWARDIRTSYSCQGGEERLAYILFTDLASADAFSRIIYRRTWKWEVARKSGRGVTGLCIAVRFPPGHIRSIERAAASAPKKRGRRVAA
jgi:hypothetical protein